MSAFQTCDWCSRLLEYGMHAPPDDRTEMLTITMGVTRVFSAEYCRACAPLALKSHMDHAEKTRPTNEQLAHFFDVKAHKDAADRQREQKEKPTNPTSRKGGAR